MSDKDALRYRITPIDPSAHLFEVRLVVPNPDPSGQRFEMPAWIPGSYMIRDYARNIVSLAASSGGTQIELTKDTKSSWVAAPTDGEIELVAEVFAYDPSVRGAHLDRTHGFFNGTCVFFEVVGQGDLPCIVDIQPPPHTSDWQVATSMQRAGADRWGFGCYQASDYAELIDHPVEMGEQRIEEFEAGGVPHAIAIRGRVRGDVERLVDDLAKICEQHCSLLGVPADLDRYLFLLHMPSSGYGGLEHRWSSANINGRDTLPEVDNPELSDGYRGLLGLLSHEYFHLWNVKRMKPDVFTPYQLDRESHTELLWVFEGVTSYYDDLALRRGGLITTESYLELLGRTMTRVARTGGRKRQSVAESSFDAWTKFYKQDANAQNSIVSYYAKGALLALSLDLILRHGTDGACSLDAVMREAWSRYGETGQGLPERGFEVLCKELSGLDLDAFFENYVYGRDDPDYGELLAPFGIRVHWRAPSALADKGGKPAKQQATVRLGAALGDDGKLTRVQAVANDSPAERAGIAPGDHWLALDGLRVSTATLDRRLRDFQPGDSVAITLFRGDEILESTLEFDAPEKNTCFLEIDMDDEAGAASRHGWLGGD